MSQDSGFSGTQIFVAFLAGAATGAALALLTSPTTGQQNREKLRGAYDTARAKLQRKGSEPKEIEE